MKKICTVLLLLLLTTGLIAQNGIIHFNQFFYDIDNSFKKSIQTKDAGYVAIHWAYSNVARTYLIKFDSNLDTTWTLNLNPSEYKDVIQLEDSSYILCGHNDNNDLKIVRVSKNGTVMWDKIFGGSGYEFGNSIVQMNNGNILILGSTNSTDGDVLNKTIDDFDVLLLEVSPSGAIVNQKLYGGSESDEGVSLIKLPNGQGFIFAAQTFSTDGMVSGNHGDGDFWVVRIADNFNFIWGTCVGGSNNDDAYSLALITDSTIIVTGSVLSTNGDFMRPDTYSAGGYTKINLAGDKLWSKTISSNLSIVHLKKVIASENGSFLLCGYGTGMDGLPQISYAQNHDGSEGIIYKLNANGNVLWNRCIGGSGGDLCYDIIKNDAGNYIICGERFMNSINGDYINFPNTPRETNSFILELKELNSISGYVYSDSNNNRIKDSNEDFFYEGFAFGTKPGLSMQSNMVDGKFLIGVDSGNYSTSVYFKTFPPFDSLQFRILPKQILSNFSGNNQTDTMTFRVVSINHFDDVEISAIFPDSIPTGVNFPAKIYFKNNLNKLVDSVKIKIKFNPAFSIVSSTPTLVYSPGDTSLWTRDFLGALEIDSITLILRSNLPAVYAPVPITGVILPFETDFDTLNNILNKNIFVYGQNAYLNNPGIDISCITNAGKGKVMPYELTYNFESALDTTNAVVKVIKDRNSVYVSAIPPITSISGDTLLWHITSLGLINRDTIKLQLKIYDGPNVQIGDTIKQYAAISFNTQDTFVLSMADTIQQIINVVCNPIDSTNTSLLEPQGIQWLRTLGGSKNESISGTAICNDSSFVVVGSTNSIDGDFSINTTDSTNGFIVKYNTNGTVIWKKTIGGNKTDGLGAIVRNTDGSFIAAGITNSNNGDFSSNHGGDDVWILKLDSAGNKLWQKTIGGSGDENIMCIKSTADGGFIFMGASNSSDGDVISNPLTDSAVWAVKLAASGNILWQKFYNDTVKFIAFDVIQTLDGGYLVAGVSPDNINLAYAWGTIVKLDNSGNIVFIKKNIVPEHYTVFNSIVQNQDSTFVLSGNIYSSNISDSTCIGDHGFQDLLISKIDKKGNILRNKYLGGADDDGSNKIIKSNDGGFIVAASTNSSNGNVSGYHPALFNREDGWLLHLDSSLNLIWQKAIGGDEWDILTDIFQLPDNSIFFTGYSNSKNNGDIFNYKGGDLDAFLGKIGNANFIRGYVFSDQNGDGIKQPTEDYFNNGYVTSNKGSLVSGSTIDQGHYANSVDTGIYITKISSSRPYYSSNPVADTSNFISYLQTDTVNFAMFPIPGIKDLNITLIPLNPARPGFATQYLIKYENIGTTVISSSTVKFVRGNKTVFDSASVAPSNITTDTLSWNFTNLSPLESKFITVYLHLLPPPQNNNGDTLIFSATISPVISDSTPLNNVSTINQLVTGSFDPNLKTETHGGTFNEKQILDGEFLNYVICFQNTGNDTAFRVVIRDTLSSSHDWKSFEMISTSHPSVLSIKDSNKLEWKFDPIILPDSNHNEIKSHGFVAFRIKPKSSNISGNLINNKASIYFDFNLPVETNNHITSVLSENFICPGSNISFASKYPGNHSYQWRVNSGTGYTNLSNNGFFNGVNTDTLKLTAIPSTYYGYKFYCIVDGNYLSPEYNLKFGTNWQGTVNTSWENPANWSCGNVPDYNTDVIVNSGLINYPDINLSSGCRSIRCMPGSSVLIKAGVQFILTGK